MCENFLCFFVPSQLCKNPTLLGQELPVFRIQRQGKIKNMQRIVITCEPRKCAAFCGEQGDIPWVVLTCFFKCGNGIFVFAQMFKSDAFMEPCVGIVSNP